MIQDQYLELDTTTPLGIDRAQLSRQCNQPLTVLRQLLETEGRPFRVGPSRAAVGHACRAEERG
jgi:hypothetical protein